jgi:hypothetical protein
MGTDIAVCRMKVADLKALAEDMGIALTGKEKKVDILASMEAAARERLLSIPADEALAFARRFDIAAAAQAELPALMPKIMASVTESAVRSLFGARCEADLESIGEELVSVESDLESVIKHVEATHSPDMADIYAIDQRLADVVKMNIDYTAMASMLDVGRIKFLDRKYVESMGMLGEAMRSSEDIFQLYGDITAAFIVLSAEKILEECRDSKSNDESAADRLIHAKRAFASRGPGRADAISRLTEVATRVHREEVAFLESRIAAAEQSLNSKKIQGVDIFNAERYLHRAREAYLLGDLGSVSAYLDKSMLIAEESERSWVQDIQNDLPRVESIIKQASDLGADVSGAEKHLSQAKASFDEGNYSLCAELKKIAERKAIETQHEQIQKAAKMEREKLAEAEKILASIIPLVREAEVYGINLSDMSGAMRSARDALMVNDYVNALTFARDAESRSRAVWSQVKANREAIMASGEQLQPCQQCRSNGVKVFAGIFKAVCANCGWVYDLQPPQQVRQPEKKGSRFWK